MYPRGYRLRPGWRCNGGCISRSRSRGNGCGTV